MEVLYCGNRDFLPFYTLCDLYFDAMTFIYEVNPYSLEMYRKCENARPASRLSNVIV